MVDVNDVRGLRVARAELSKRGIDTVRADVRMMHGILYLRGLICTMPGSAVSDIQSEVEHIAHILRQKPEIRDVILECTYGERGVGSKTATHRDTSLN
jgi:hypothetical protein